MSYMMVLFVLLKVAITCCRAGDIPNDFIFNGCVNLDGTAKIDSNGLFTLSNSTRQKTGHVFFNYPFQFKNSSNGSVVSFSTTFIFAIVTQNPPFASNGMAFVISPTKEIQGALPRHIGLFNETNVGKRSNRIVAVELDTMLNYEFDDINDNHVGIDFNGLMSIKSAPAGYFLNHENGALVFNNLTLKSGEPLQVWVEYDGTQKQLNVTLSPIGIPRPELPLLSLTQDLSPFLLEYMYVGFSSSTCLFATNNYILGWSFKMNGQAPQIDLSRLPKLPKTGTLEKEQKNIKRILAIVLPVIVFLLLLVLITVAHLISRTKRFMEVLEDWEVQYGPHRFRYKDLLAATKGFKERELLGRGGFGSVYRGVLQSTNAQVAIKRVAHDSRQGMREFVAEIATIGRLRHPNLVRLLGYCRRRGELLLVYDFMPNGSLDKFLYGQPKQVLLSWTQRFKIIKDVASGLLYLHEQWVQVVIHRDVKASNVLIDGEFNARLGDFGLAKLCDHGTDLQTSHVAGTLGYIAPELARTGKASTSTDLFALGAFMLEVVCGRRPVEPRAASPAEIILIDWVLECFERGNILEAVDQGLGAGHEDDVVEEEAELVLKLGLLCSHPVAAARPSISTVVQYLGGEAQLPNNLIEILTSREFGEVLISDEQTVSPPTSIPALTISEPFIYIGR